jgi:predicted dehydrogenase
VPTLHHVEVARRCLEAGLDVLVEKPICESLADCDALIALAAAKGRFLQVGHLERFSPLVAAAATAVPRPAHIEAERLSPLRGRGLDTSVILDMMIHDLDHVLALAGAPVSAIEAVGGSVATGRIDFAEAQIRFANGVSARVSASRVAEGIHRHLRLLGRDAYAIADHQHGKLTVERRGASGRSAAETRKFDSVDLLMHQAESFVSAVRTRARPRVSGADIRPVLAAALDISRAVEAWAARAL